MNSTTFIQHFTRTSCSPFSFTSYRIIFLFAPSSFPSCSFPFLLHSPSSSSFVLSNIYITSLTSSSSSSSSSSSLFIQSLPSTAPSSSLIFIRLQIISLWHVSPCFCWCLAFYKFVQIGACGSGGVFFVVLSHTHVLNILFSSSESLLCAVFLFSFSLVPSSTSSLQCCECNNSNCSSSVAGFSSFMVVCFRNSACLKWRIPLLMCSFGNVTYV